MLGVVGVVGVAGVFVVFAVFGVDPACNASLGTVGGATCMGSLVGVAILRGVGMIERFFGSTVGEPFVTVTA